MLPIGYRHTLVNYLKEWFYFLFKVAKGSAGPRGTPIPHRWKRPGESRAAYLDMEPSEPVNCCLGPPPPKFLLHPPPPPSLDAAELPEFAENSTSALRMCQILSVIDAEYQAGQVVPSVAVVVVVAAATVLVFCCIGIVLVVLKKRKLRQLLPRKSSPQNQFHGANTSGIIYEDFGNVLPSSCPHGQSTESIRSNSYTANPMMFSSLLIRSHPSSARSTCDYQNLFCPEYEPSENPFSFDEPCQAHTDEYACIAEDLCVGSIKVPSENALQEENIYECLDLPEGRDNRNEYTGVEEVGTRGTQERKSCSNVQRTPGRTVLDRRRREKEVELKLPIRPPNISDLHDDPLLEDLFQLCPDGSCMGTKGRNSFRQKKLKKKKHSPFARLSNRPNQQIFTTHEDFSTSTEVCGSRITQKHIRT
ncbi:hypothetical protein RUM43_008036 [Polyplax serrata]|uniref:Uncharacterized protein n=1 Tax=Polyplax serrata TaxID=468196 RepID=A0AAN8PE73_POLSC